MNLVKYLLVFCAVSLSVGLPAQTFSALDSIINLQINKHNTPGAVGLVIKEGKVLYDKAFGYANLELKTPMSTQSIFRIASQTKAVVSVAFLQLVEKGAVGLDDPIEKYFPAFSTQKVISGRGDSLQLVDRVRSVTIRDLLTHQSGISSPDEYPTYAYLYKKYNLDKPLNGSYATLTDEVAQIAQMPLMHQPGERFSYGLSTNVIGALIEKISGLSLDAYLLKNIFEPLGMKDTYFYLPKNKHDRLVKLYAKNTDTSLALVPPVLFNADFPLQKNSKYFSAIGGLVSTTHDYAKFLTCLLEGGALGAGKQLLSKRTIDALTTNQLGAKTFIFGGFPSLNNFGLGVGLTSTKGQVINNASEGSYFWGGAFNTAYMVDPKRKLITLFFFQRTPFALSSVLSSLEKATIKIIDQNK
jgi:CubicO group peptidase (beta-lactamase class C family)